MLKTEKDETRQIPDADRMSGFAKGLDVIEAFSHDGQALTIAEVARRTGLDRASARRCLLTLVDKGYADYDGRHFFLTPRILGLARAYLGASLPSVLQPSLENLAKALGESCSASVLEGNEIIYIARASLRRVMSIELTVGTRLPAYCTSMGRVLLAALPVQEARKRLLASDRVAMTERTLTDIDSLMSELTKVRNAGYALNDQELEIGLRSIAVPVFNAQGRVVAAINAGVQAARATQARLRSEFLPRLLETQEQLAKILM